MTDWEEFGPIWASELFIRVTDRQRASQIAGSTDHTGLMVTGGEVNLGKSMNRRMGEKTVMTPGCVAQ